MIATIINCIAVIVGSALGLLFRKRISDALKDVVYTAIGVVTLGIAVLMVAVMQRPLFAALALALGGIVGHYLRIHDGILSLGEFLRRSLMPRGREQDTAVGGVQEFAWGFLNASVLFCIGAMSILGSIQAGADGDYTLLLTKSVMDGFMSIIMAAAMGAGVLFSSLFILVYQGAITLLAGVLKPWMTPLIISELKGIGGLLVIMIGLNLLKLKEIRTANFIPALFFTVALVVFDPLISGLLNG